MKTFRVWFYQVNQTMFDVHAVNEEEAKQKAAQEWKQEFGEPEEYGVLELKNEN